MAEIIIPKDRWGPGPWQDEPDELAWIDQATGLDCHIIRHIQFGNFCGYAGVPPTHPAYGLSWDGVPDKEAKERHREFMARLRNSGGNPFKMPPSKFPDTKPVLGIGDKLCEVSVHGGLTFAGILRKRNVDLWFFGFDCGHAGDFSPGMHATLRFLHQLDNTTKQFEAYAGFCQDETYRTIDYVKAECTELARQLKGMEGTLWQPTMSKEAKTKDS